MDIEAGLWRQRPRGFYAATFLPGGRDVSALASRSMMGEAIAEGFQRLHHVALRHKDLWRVDDIAFLCACRLPLDTPVDRQQQTQIGGNLAK